VTFIILGHRSGEVRHVKGWKTLMAGFALIFFGTLIDITDNFTELNRFVIVGDTPVQAFLEKVVGYLMGFMFLAVGIWQWLPRIVEHQKLIAENLEKAKKEVKYLQGLLPICASCKKIWDDKGYWKQIETYIAEHSEAKFSHSICPACAKKLYPDFYEEMAPQAAPADAAPRSARPCDDEGIRS
jgi:hypothetical protein